MSETRELSVAEQLREAARINANRCGLEHDDMLDWTAADELDRLEAIVAKLEWSGVQIGPGSGPCWSGGDGIRMSSCPLCKGIKPGVPKDIDYDYGHKPGCFHAEAAAGEGGGT